MKFCGSGGAPLPLEVQQRFQEITGCRLTEGWGMTETSPTGTFTPPNGPVKPGSCGIPIPGITIKFANVEDPSKYVPSANTARSASAVPNVMKGYWKNPEATADVMTPDGFMRTGDVAYMDEDGFIFIVDRTKDMLLCGGFNVYPRIIEEAIYQHPSVEEVCVIGIRDEYRGQSPKAFIKLKAGAPPITLEEMKNFLKDKLGKHEMLRRHGNPRRVAEDCRSANCRRRSFTRRRRASRLRLKAHPHPEERRRRVSKDMADVFALCSPSRRLLAECSSG